MNKPNIVVLIIAFVIFVFAVDLTIVKCEELRQEAKEESRQKTKIIACYGDVLHRIWIDKPSYVEDALMDSEEWSRLDSILNGDFEDVFLFWNDKEKETYKNNCYEQSLYSSHTVCDYLSSRNVTQIRCKDKVSFNLDSPKRTYVSLFISATDIVLVFNNTEYIGGNSANRKGCKNP